jgi:hypothetical protein
MALLTAALENGNGTNAFHLLMSMAKKFPEEKLVVDFHLQSFLGE